MSAEQNEDGRAHKNWPVIAGIEDVHLRMAVAMSEGEDEDCFRRGFPQFFTDVEVENPGVGVPVSEIRRALRKWSAENSPGCRLDLDFELQHVLDAFPVPQLGQWVGTEQDPRPEYDPVPQEVLEQLVGQTFRPGMTFHHRGKLWAVAYISASATQGEPFPADASIDYLCPVPAGAIDFSR